MKKFLILIGVVLGVTLLGIYFFTIGFQINPKNAYRVNFTTPMSQINHLKGKGLAWQGHDLYLTFESKNTPQLRNGTDYQSISCNEILDEYFLKQFPWNKNIFNDRSRYTCWAHPANSNIKGKIFIKDTTSNQYYFRSWKL